MPEIAMETPQVGGTSLDVVAREFVDQYYRILQQSPDQMYKFYLEWSTLSHHVNDMTTSVTTLQGIHQKIMAMGAGIIWEIETVVAQQLQNGALICVTGYLTGPDRLRWFFCQSIFLAPQEDLNNRFYILNDVLHIRLFVDSDVVLQAGKLLMEYGRILVPGNSTTYLQPNGVPLQTNSNVPIFSSDVEYVLTNGTGSGGTTQASLATKPGHESHAHSWGWPHSQPSKCSKPTNAMAITEGPAVQAKVPLSPNQEDMELALAIEASIRSAIIEGVPDVFYSVPVVQSQASFGTNDWATVSGTVNTSLGAVNGSYDKKEGAGTCVICQDAPVEGAFIPCGHMAGCMGCLRKIKEKRNICPICRAKINEVLKLYAV